MSTTQNVELAGKVQSIGPVTLLRAELTGDAGNSFAIVYFALHGKEQREGLRLDVSKRVFLDLTGDSIADAQLGQAASNVVTVISEAIAKKTKQTSAGGYSSEIIAALVDEARRTGWNELPLTNAGAQVSDLQRLLREPGVERLQRLSLAFNEIGSLPPEIGRLTALRELYLQVMQLSALPPEICRLTALTKLILSSNQLSTLPPEILRLTALTDLRLSSNQLSTLSPEISQLSALTTLDLSRNQLSALPREISRLSALTTLNLSSNRLSALPREIGRLSALTTLDLSHNQLSVLPPEFGRLSALKYLHLNHNELSGLPLKIRQLTDLQWLFLHNNDALGIPPEVLGPTHSELGQKKMPAEPSAILDYYFRNRAASERRALNEVKVTLVGQGSVGKTSLVKRIIYDTFNKNEQKTDGIYIEKAWRVPGKTEAETVQVNFWDFGGQEIMHATHQFFLTKRTIYLLVLDARKGDNESNIHYWLKIIRSFGGDAPVLVVTNKCDAHHLELNETRLKKDYPNIQAFFRTSCESGTGIAELKAAIQAQIRGDAMRHVFDLLPKEYFTVKERLERLAEAKNYIDIREYYQLCASNGVTDIKEQDALLRFLHDLGSVLSFTDPTSPLQVREMSVLNPHWVTQGVYKILNDNALATQGGVLTEAALARILAGCTHPASCHPFIIGMMHKFELCFTIDDDQKWLVAELLPENEPESLSEWEDALRFEYHYKVLPGGIICRFIVRRYEELTDPPVYWRSGVVLKHDGCKALVRCDKDKGRMYIAVIGPVNGRRAFLSVIRDEFDRIHATIPNLLAKQMVPLPDDADVAVSYENLLTQERQGVTDFIPDGAEKRYAVTELLDGIEYPWLRKFGESHLYPPLFVIEPQTSFADAWEVFCCDILNLHEKTTKIRRRKAPEGGIDLYRPDKKIAYQCKSVEEPTGKFSITKACKSLKDALETRKELPWDTYVICSNVDLTGNQEQQLRDLFPDVEFLTPGFWIPRCREQSKHLGGRFRRLTDMDGHRPRRF